MCEKKLTLIKSAGVTNDDDNVETALKSAMKEAKRIRLTTLLHYYGLRTQQPHITTPKGPTILKIVDK